MKNLTAGNYKPVVISKDEFKKCPSWGLHAVIDLYGCNPELIKSFKEIERFVIELCELIDMKRYGKAMIERFASDYYEGVSLLQFVETSSITAHFDEQENRAFIDIFSCKYFAPEKAVAFCQNFFKAKDNKVQVLLRD
jgi:S-adenosylmethionine/arginine decarboxylase-like enzyme